MLWMLPLATGALSAVAADKKNRQMEAQNKAQAEQTRYSAWSGLGGGQINNQYADPLAAGLGGGLQGAAFWQGLKEAPVAPTAAASEPMTAGQSYLGGNQMAQNLGQDYQSPWMFMGNGQQQLAKY